MYLSMYLSIYLSICLSVYLSIYLCILTSYEYLCMYVSIYLSSYLSVCLSINLSTYVQEIYMTMDIDIHIYIYINYIMCIYVSGPRAPPPNPHHIHRGGDTQPYRYTNMYTYCTYFHMHILHTYVDVHVCIYI